ncbi:hypothetical protein EVAR_57581_1 [Eumeta japonica]|uniref:Fatty acyl-CoA reductase n=1 Tax=Eumeta variegata TaxID=151549 RepID=A0A4C1Z8S8_EUMVA|nr:hypothetical protein EVAR_57581_1 [Eumeta japonica]
MPEPTTWHHPRPIWPNNGFHKETSSIENYEYIECTICPVRSCPDIKKIYILARPKKNKDAMKRLQEQFDDVPAEALPAAGRGSCFERELEVALRLIAPIYVSFLSGLYDKLRRIHSNFIQKVGIIEGDIGQVGLGLSDEDRRKISDESSEFKPFTAQRTKLCRSEFPANDAIRGYNSPRPFLPLPRVPVLCRCYTFVTNFTAAVTDATTATGLICIKFKSHCYVRSSSKSFRCANKKNRELSHIVTL